MKLFTAAVTALSIGVVILTLAEIPQLKNFANSIMFFTEISLYVFVIVAYFALNDEKNAFRPQKDILNQKKIKRIKIFLVAIFLVSLLKPTLQSLITTINSNSSLVTDMLLSLFNVIFSMPTLLLAVSLRYYFRDANSSKVRIYSLVSVIVSGAYFSYKFVAYFINYSNVELPISIFSEFSQYMFCLLQYGVNIFMFTRLKKYFEVMQGKKQETEKEKISNNEYPLVRESITENSGFGLDNADDFVRGIIE